MPKELPAVIFAGVAKTVKGCDVNVHAILAHRRLRGESLLGAYSPRSWASHERHAFPSILNEPAANVANTAAARNRAYSLRRIFERIPEQLGRLEMPLVCLPK